jgi:hypothetical protein
MYTVPIGAPPGEADARHRHSAASARVYAASGISATSFEVKSQ